MRLQDTENLLAFESEKLLFIWIFLNMHEMIGSIILDGVFVIERC